MEADKIVDTLAETESGDRVWIEAEGVEGWFTIESSMRTYTQPEKDLGRWVEGELTRHLIIPDEMREEMELVYRSGYLSAATESGEWRRPTIELPEEGDASDWTGERREVQSATVVPAEMWEFREAALGESYSLRVTALRRAIYLDAAARCAASERACDVWWDYIDEDDEPSLSGFVEWLEVETLRQLWREVGEQMFFGEGEGVMDVKDRALADTLSVLRYFHS